MRHLQIASPGHRVGVWLHDAPADQHGQRNGERSAAGGQRPGQQAPVLAPERLFRLRSWRRLGRRSRSGCRSRRRRRRGRRSWCWSWCGLRRRGGGWSWGGLWCGGRGRLGCRRRGRSRCGLRCRRWRWGLSGSWRGCWRRSRGRRRRYSRRQWRAGTFWPGQRQARQLPVELQREFVGRHARARVLGAQYW